MKRFFRKLWAFIDGGKSTFGLTLIAFSPLFGKYGEMAKQAGYVIAGTGGVDKLRKGLKRMKETP